MNRRLFVSLWVAVVAFSVGCSDGDSGPTGYQDAGLELDQCLSSTDMDIVMDSRMDGSVYDPLHEAKVCHLDPECYQLTLDEMYEEAYACVHECWETQPSGDLSTGCRDCFTAEGAGCGSYFCLIPCLGDDIPLCQACFNEHCRGRLDACIGY